MNTKWLMTVTSAVLGLTGVLLLFVPTLLLEALGVEISTPLSLLIQMIAAFYVAFAAMNWTAKDTVIGGIYNRPLSLGNFTHFFIGALVLIRYLLSNNAPFPLLVAALVYTVFAGLFAWLVFKHGGIPDKK
jgi:hypothetical protein